MIHIDEVEEVATRFGVADSQVIRDHLISSVLLALADDQMAHQTPVTFFGGTALCRTWIPDLRLSEDVDLLVNAGNDAQNLTQRISMGLRRDFPEHSWGRLGSQDQVDSWNLHDASATVRVQFVQWRHRWKEIPTTLAPVLLRYSDLPTDVHMTVPTPTGFAAMKLMAWFDRQTPRDLFDLAALAERGHIDHRATSLVKRISGFTPHPSLSTCARLTGPATWLDTTHDDLGLPATSSLRAELHSMLVHEPQQFFAAMRSSSCAAT